MKQLHRGFLYFSIVAAALLLSLSAHAQTYPSRQISLIVPFPPGGSTDTTARILAEHMSATLGVPVIVENVGGAGGTIALGRVARAAPDGYTIDIGQWDTHVGAVIYNPNYDLKADFQPIGLISINPQLIVARTDLPADNLKSLVGWMRANPGKINFVNQLAAANVSAVLFEQLTGQKVELIPYRGAGPAMTDLIARRVDLLVTQSAAAMPQLRAGTIKALANMSAQRSQSLPDIPTSDESGVPGLHMSGWFAFFAPKGTPADASAKLNGAMVEALADPAVRARLAELGLDVAPREQQTPQYLADFLQAETDKWWPIIKAAGIKADN
jgi:tripartite-type tricarboxylate transporter receptor subunit TctC